MYRLDVLLSQFGTSVLENKERTQPCPSTENWIDDLLSMAPPIRTKQFPPQSVSPIRKLP